MENDIQGNVMLEIISATDLPQLKNSEFPLYHLFGEVTFDLHFLW
jgi:hypothetical protein